jgi:ferredoxin
MVDRTALDRIIQAYGYTSAHTGGVPDGNAMMIPKDNADASMDAAACIGCGACVASCPNARPCSSFRPRSAHLGLLPQGEVEAARRVRTMVAAMDQEGFGNCTNHYECEATCPKGIKTTFISLMNRELLRFQRPGPPFALLPELWRETHFDAGDRFEMAASFWGRGVHALADFARVLQSLGKVGFHRSQGVFELVTIEAEDAGGSRSPIWREGEGLQNLAPPINEVGWWLSRQSEPAAILLEFLTPARLMAKDRPLFKINFHRLFPFLLRRVTGMLYAHCGREVIDDPGRLLAAAVQVRAVESSFCWHDWRTLEGPESFQDLGGISGSVRLEGDALQDVLGILRIGSLMNVGKGAAFGAGHFHLRELETC